MRWFVLFCFVVCIAGGGVLLGTFLARLYQGERTFLHPVLGKAEDWLYHRLQVNPWQEMDWIEYGKGLFYFNLWGFLALFMLCVWQGYLPLNPQGLPGTSWDLAFNIASSFVTNTNWQSYSGENTLSYLTQTGGLTVQNFLSPATGMCALLAFIRGLIRRNTTMIGNVFTDIVRTILYVLLPLSVLMALFLVGEGVVQTYAPYVEVEGLEGGKQLIPLGPVASQVAIKQIGTNGGGFFGANSAHPFENPTPLSNFFQMVAIALIPAACVCAYGEMIGHRRHGWLLFIVMGALWAIAFGISLLSERSAGVTLGATPLYEGIETRIGIYNSLIWSTMTTATSSGSVNAMLSSLPPIAGGICIFNIMKEELIFGGIGTGLLSMNCFVLLTVFLSGLMVGRTPEYMGKKLEIREIQLVSMVVLFPGLIILGGAAWFCKIPEALASLGNPGPHGLTELLYAFSSCVGNNGSSFAGLNSNTPLYNIVLGMVMLSGRLAVVLPSLALAGALAGKNKTPPTVGTLSTDTVLFAVLLLGVIWIVGALTFFPALSMGPVVEHLLMLKHRFF